MLLSTTVINFPDFCKNLPAAIKLLAPSLPLFLFFVEVADHTAMFHFFYSHSSAALVTLFSTPNPLFLSSGLQTQHDSPACKHPPHAQSRLEPQNERCAKSTAVTGTGALHFRGSKALNSVPPVSPHQTLAVLSFSFNLYSRVWVNRLLEPGSSFEHSS